MLFRSKAFGLISKETDVVHIGNLTVVGKSNRFQCLNSCVVNHTMSVFVDCRKKCYQQIQETMNIDYKISGNDILLQKHTALAVVTPPVRQMRDVDVSLLDSDFVGCKTMDAIDEPYHPKNGYGGGFDPNGYYDLEDDAMNIDIDFDHFPMHNHPRRPGFLKDCWR